jgi:hypothetical protein
MDAPCQCTPHFRWIGRLFRLVIVEFPIGRNDRRTGHAVGIHREKTGDVVFVEVRIGGKGHGPICKLPIGNGDSRQQLYVVVPLIALEACER